MAGGVDVDLSGRKHRLGEEILTTGARLSEQPVGLIPQARHFPRRNRIISGMASCVVVVEAATKSGSLITARNAADQGRDVMAVPGHPFDARAAGCNMLIRDGATLVRSAQTSSRCCRQPRYPRRPPTPEALHFIQSRSRCPFPRNRSLQDTAALHSQILNRLGPSPLAEDQLIRDLGAAAHQVSPVLVDLELDGRIHRDAGGLLRLA